MFSRRLIAAMALTLTACAAGCASEQETDGEVEEGTDAFTATDPADPAYASGKRHSSMTPEVIASLKAVLAGGKGDPHSFIKVGDSITASTDFLNCLAKTPVAKVAKVKALAANDSVRTTANLNLRAGAGTSFTILRVIPLGSTLKVVDPKPKNGFLNIDFNGIKGWSSQAYLAQVAPADADDGDDTEEAGPEAGLESARTFFNQGSWQRLSKASVPGWHTNQPIAGSPMPIEIEVSERNPSFAVVMLGTNDNFEGNDTFLRTNLTKVLDALLRRHVVPILSTIPSSGRSVLDKNIPRMNGIIRNLAADKKIPLMDYHAALAPLPGRGISSDTIHPTRSANSCDFSANGLKNGYNVRTLLALEAIARMKQFLVDAAPPEKP